MKKLTACVLALMLMLSLAVPAQAALEYKLLYDATECFDRETCWEIGSNQLVTLSDAYQTQIRVDIVTDTEEHTLEEYAQVFYAGFDYGYKDTQDGILLMLKMQPDDTGVVMEDYTVCCGGANKAELEGFLTLVEPHLAASLQPQNWDGDMEADNQALVAALNAFMTCADGFLSGALEPIWPEEILKEGIYVTDSPDLLTPEQWQPLEQAAREVTEKYNLGIYIAIIGDFTADGSTTMEEAAQTHYQKARLGRGFGRDGLLLLISRAEGDYTILPRGSAAQLFGEPQIGALSDILLDRFAAGNPSKGLADYIARCDAILSGEELPAEEATAPEAPEPSQANFYFPIVLVISAALLILILREQRQGKKKEAT